MEKLVLATNNAHKVHEIKRMLQGSAFAEVITMKEAGLDVEIEETGVTFEENSLLKASVVCKLTGSPALADDSGLCVKALNGAPGVYSARYAGEEHDDNKNIDKLLLALDGVTDRSAEFVTVLSVVYPDGHKVVAVGKTDGYITEKRMGNGGFGYDPVFYSNDLHKTFGEATEDEKNAVSHRGRALQNLKNILTK